jgi:hypothetical protein
VRFSIAGELQPIQLCYCAQCRKAQGGAFAGVTPVATEVFTLHEGADLIRHFESSPGKERAFCGRCGSPIYSRRTAIPTTLRLRVGLLDGPLGVKPSRHAYVADKADWWDILDDLPQYPGAAP